MHAPLPSDLPPAPPYGRRTLGELLPSVAAGLGVRGYQDVLQLGDIDRVAVLLVDGLGAHLLARNAAQAPFLAGLLAAPGAVAGLASGFPSTTPQGLGALGTGLAPGAHGLVGASFHVPEWGAVLSPLRWRDEPNPVATQPEPTVFERAHAAGVVVTSVSPRAFEGSGLTRAVLRGGGYPGADSDGERVAGAAAALRAGARSLVYVYAGELDRTGHVHGVDSPHWRAQLAHVDLLARQLAETLPSGAVLHVTADHGMVDCDGDDHVELDRFADLWEGVRTIAGEPRARQVYTRPGAREDVAAAWRAVLGDRAWVLTRLEALELGWFGEVDPVIEHRIGDVVVAARGTVRLGSSRTDSIVSGLRGQHGSLTDDETDVPLLTVRA